MVAKKTFVTSDWHVGHQRSIIYDSRPFRDIKHMHSVLINNYNSSVSQDCVCYFLGDLGWKGALADVYPKLNGKKIAVLGNHDNNPSYLYDIGFDLVLNGAMVTLGRSIITMTHCPLRGVWREDPVSKDGTPMTNFTPGDNWHGESRHKAYSLPDFNQFHLHGHTHKLPKERTLDRQFDVGVVANDYRPVSFSTIESWIANYKKELK